MFKFSALAEEFVFLITTMGDRCPATIQYNGDGALIPLR
jgi:hypothetical protein